MNTTPSTDKPPVQSSMKLKFLTYEQITRIDELLSIVGDYGEVHLIIVKGELRFINQLESHRSWDGEAK